MGIAPTASIQAAARTAPHTGKAHWARRGVRSVSSCAATESGGAFLAGDFERAGDFLTFTDCPDELDEDTWGSEGRDLWMAFDGARFGIGFGDVTRTDLRDYWSDDSWAQYENSLIASYIAVNQVNDDGEIVYMGDALASCLLFEYDAVTGELVDDDDDDVLELIDLSGVGEGDPMPESYVRCFAYWWPQLGSFDLSRLAEGANGSPSDTGT